MRKTEEDVLFAIALLAAIAGFLNIRKYVVEALSHFYAIKRDAEWLAWDKRSAASEDAELS